MGTSLPSRRLADRRYLRRLLLASFAMSAMFAMGLAGASTVSGEDPIPLTATISASKTYDGGTAGTPDDVDTCVLSPDPSPDQVACDLTNVALTFESADAGSEIPVTVEGLGLTGEDASKYSIDLIEATGTIDPTDPTCVVTGYDVTYNAASHSATGSCTGVNDEPVDGELDLSGTEHTDAGAYPDEPWSFTSDDPNYNDDDGTVSSEIDKADPTCDVDGYDVTYNAALHSATGSCTGVDDEDVDGDFDFSATEHTDAGTYSNEPWSFTSSDPNYNDASGVVSSEIDKAEANCSISGYSATYDGISHGATGSCTGVDAGGTAAGSTLDLGESFRNFPGGTANWEFEGGTNYNDQADDVSIVIGKAPLTITATVNTKTADGSPSAAAVPTVTSGTVFTTTGDTVVGQLSETYTSAAAGFPKTLVPAGVVSDGNNGDNYSYTYVNNNAGRIRPGPVASLEFTAEPTDTKIGTPIYNVCTPGGSPCATSSPPVEVTARDAFGHLAGPGAPGADPAGPGTLNPPIYVLIRKDNGSGQVIGPTGGTPTNAGVASFGSTLVLTGPFTGDINLFAVAVGTNSANDTSADFRIVNDLAPCRGPLCQNNAGNGGNSRTLQFLYGQIATGDSYGNTTLTTQFLGANSIDGQCGNNNTINMPVELRAIGSDVTITDTGYMVMIMPKSTLKAEGVVSRGTPHFNVCLGALYLGDGTHAYGSGTAPGWMAKQPTGNGLIRTEAEFDTDSGFFRYWGTVADCGASGLTSTDPCVLLRTKQKSAITQLINQEVLSAGADANMKDSDIAIVIRKPSPWDGKGGMY